MFTKTLRRALHEEDHAKARACVVALHRSRKHATEDYAGMFLDELRSHPTRDLIRDTATLVSNEAFRAALISNDGINVLLPLARDAALADAAERCLAVVAAHPRGAADLLKGGAARHACARLAEDPTSGGASLLLGALRRTRRRSSCARPAPRGPSARGCWTRTTTPASGGLRSGEGDDAIAKRPPGVGAAPRQVAGKRRGEPGGHGQAPSTPFVRETTPCRNSWTSIRLLKCWARCAAGRTTTSWRGRAPGSSRAPVRR